MRNKAECRKDLHDNEYLTIIKQYSAADAIDVVVSMLSSCMQVVWLNSNTNFQMLWCPMYIINEMEFKVSSQ